MKILQPRRLHPRKAAFVLAALAAFTAYTTLRPQPPKLWKWGGEIMGAGYGIQVVADLARAREMERVRWEVDDALKAINAEFSTWLPDSAVSRFNAQDATVPFAASARLLEATRLCLNVSERSSGAFDITFSPLFDLWGFGRQGPRRVPSEEAVAQTMTRCGYRFLSVKGTSIVKAIPGLQVVYNAIVPGFAAEEVSNLLHQRGFTNTYVDVGGEIRVRGHNHSGQPWRVGIERPDYDATEGAAVEVVLNVSDRAVATSGDYRNYVTGEDGQRYAHIFDTRTGRPASTRVASVSVVATNAGLADALATTLFAMGPAEGIPWLTNWPGTEALFLMRDGTSYVEQASAGMAAFR